MMTVEGEHNAQQTATLPRLSGPKQTPHCLEHRDDPLRAQSAIQLWLCFDVTAGQNLQIIKLVQTQVASRVEPQAGREFLP